jgi:mono/diheme cytochrome c family protein
MVASGGPPASAKPSPKPSVEDPLAIPAADRDRHNPIAVSEEALRLGRVLWHTHCETCHGTQGRGDGPNARLHEKRKGHAPRNLTEADVQENLTDGELFFRISKGIVDEGNIIMPAYERKIPAESNRWQLVLFVRELGRAARR